MNTTSNSGSSREAVRINFSVASRPALNVMTLLFASARLRILSLLTNSVRVSCMNRSTNSVDRLRSTVIGATLLGGIFMSAGAQILQPPTNLRVDGTCPASAFTPGGSDGRGGCFAGPANTGVPSGTVLSNYTGSCTISVANTVIDSKTINCAPLLISAANVTISRSRINGYVGVKATEGVWSGGSNSNSLNISDSEIVGPTSIDNNSPTGLGEMHWYAKRVAITGFRRSAHCLRECTLEDSFLKQDGTPKAGSTLEPNAIHASGLRAGPNMLIRGNTIHCAMSNVQEAGCSSNLTIYGEYGQQHHITVENNYFPASGGGYCVYGGDTHGRTDSNYIVFRNNFFGRQSQGGSQHTVNGLSTCAWYGTGTSFTPGNTGNIWTGNVYVPDLKIANYPN